MSAQAAFPLARPSVLELRDYQRAALDAVHEARGRGVTRQLISLPTGAGKTYVAAHLVAELNLRTVFMVHRDELARQTVNEMRQVNPSLSIGVCKADQDELSAQIIVASQGTLARESRLNRLRNAVGPAALFISDEAHHDRASSRMRAIEVMAPSLLVGLTATPARGDKLGLDAIYQEIVYHLPMRTLVERQHLARPVGLRIETEIDIDAVHTSKGDLAEGELARTVDTDARNSVIVEAWKTHAADRKRTIVFCVTVTHAERVRDAFRDAGVVAEMVDGDTPIDERQRIFRAFHEGGIQVLTNCMVLTEGFNEPRIDCCIMARPTKNVGLFIQCVGRALRWSPGKADALIIDVVDVTSKHSLVTLPSLSGIEPGKDGERPLSEKDRAAGQVMDLFDAVAHQGKLRERDAIMVDLLEESPFVWQPLPGGKFMASRGSGWVTVIPEGDGFVPVNVWLDREKGAGFELLLDRPVDPETAMSVAQSSIPANVLTNKDGPWRGARPTEKQLTAARNWRLLVSPTATRGEVTDQLQIAMFRAAMKKLGLEGKGIR